MVTSDKGIRLIQEFESCVLFGYPDPMSELGQACEHLGLPLTEYTKVPRWQLLKANPATIGWGHTGPLVKLGEKIPQEVADAYLRMDVHFAEYALHGLPLNQNQFDALVCFIFNVGGKAFQGSTLHKKVVAGDYPAAADEFLKWNHAGGKVLPGLTKRRQAERALFLTPVQEGAA